MTVPKIPCRVLVDCPVNPSEDPGKVLAALSSILPGVDFEHEDSRMHAHPNDLGCLEHLSEEIRRRRLQRSLQRQIRLNLHGDSFWFYLNKQAAFSGTAALCERDDESPLGPIRISANSGRIADVAAWLSGDYDGDYDGERHEDGSR